MGRPGGQALEHKPEIDGLRAVAVAAVVAYHALPGLLPGGFVGVDAFFVISGYLITRLLAQEHARTGRIDFPAFYARRARRLLPALLVMVLGVMLALVVLMGRHESLVADAATSSAWSLVFAANFHFQGSVGGYFDMGAEARPMLHLWSLAVEEQFYLAYPALLALLLAKVPGAPARRLALLALASLLLSEYWANLQPAAAFYQMPARFWELAAGALVALSPASSRPRAWDAWLMPLGLAMVLFAAWSSGGWKPFPGKSALPVVLGASLVLLAVHRNAVSGLAARLLRSRAFVGLGLVSYSLYLWHWPLLVMLGQSAVDPPGAWQRAGACLLALVLAALSWRFVETPARALTTRRPWRLLGAAALAVGATAALIHGLAGIDRLPAEARRLSEMARGDKPEILQGCHFDASHRIEQLPGDACRSRPGQPPTVALWGDSHAMAWQPFAWRLAEAADASAAPLTLNSCPPGPGRANAGPDRACDRFNHLAMQWLEGQPIDTLVVAQRWPLDPPGNGTVPSRLAARVDQLERALDRLGHVRQVIVLGPLPAQRWRAPDCLALGWEAQCRRPADQHRRQVAAVWERLDALARKNPRVVLLDPTDYFCDATWCPPSRHGFGLYWDTNHITASASRGFADAWLADPARYTRRPGTASATTDNP